MRLPKGRANYLANRKEQAVNRPLWGIKESKIQSQMERTLPLGASKVQTGGKNRSRIAK